MYMSDTDARCDGDVKMNIPPVLEELATAKETQLAGSNRTTTTRDTEESIERCS
jgi:hypothetical protein